MSVSVCMVGIELGEECGGDLYYPTEEEKKILKFRIDSENEVTSTCMSHKTAYLTLYAKGVKSKSCADPFKIHKVKLKRNLREITLATAVKYSATNLKLIPGQKLCTNCRKKLANFHVINEECASSNTSLSTTTSSIENQSEEDYYDITMDIVELNKSMLAIGESPIKQRKLSTQKRYPEEKLQQIESTIRKKLNLKSPTSTETEDPHYEKKLVELIDQLKEKYKESKERSIKMQILTVLPKSWTIRRIEEEFEVSNWMACAAKKLMNEKGAMSTPNPKQGRPMSIDVLNKVDAFYKSSDISREMLGMKDCVSARDDEGVKVKLQKRLILCNLQEAYRNFKDSSPELKIGFSKFATLRPKNVVLPGASGTHSVCVCPIHQNVKLMFHGAKLSNNEEVKRLLNCEDVMEPLTYKHLLAYITCNPSLPECHIGECNVCDDKSTKVLELHELLTDIFEELCVNEITYKSWVTVDRTNLETIVKETDEFFQVFVKSLIALRRHDFIAKQQTSYMNDIKASDMDGTALAVGDFAENYSFVLQDAAQGFHWTNSQATIHPFVIYYEDIEENCTALKHSSFVVVSDRLKHNTVAIHRFQKDLIEHIKTLIPRFEKVIYFSDGAASQYKNRKNFINISYHKQDFGVDAEWHFFATSHGKGPCDGIGGTVNDWQQERA